MAEAKIKCICSQYVFPQHLRQHFIECHFAFPENSIPGELYCQEEGCSFHTDSVSRIIEHCAREVHSPTHIRHSVDIFRPHMLNLTARIVQQIEEAEREKNESDTSGQSRRRRSSAESAELGSRSLDLPTLSLDTSAPLLPKRNLRGSDITPSSPLEISAPATGKEKKPAKKARITVVPKPIPKKKLEEKKSMADELIGTKESTAGQSSERPYKCKICDFRPKMRNTKERSALRSHVRCHMAAEDKQFLCVVQGCGYASNYRIGVKDHIQKEHGMSDDPQKKTSGEEYVKALEDKVKDCFGDV